MTTAHVFIGTSLDGFIARLNGDLDWMTGPSGGDDYGYADFFGSVDAIVMGRGTYEKVLTFGAWPFDKPVMVASRTLTQAELRADLAERVEVTSDSPRAILEAAAARGWSRVYVDGGKLIQSFLREGLIADMIVSRLPVLIGEGLPLFGPIEGDLKLTHVETRSYPSGLVQSRYARAA